MKISFQIHFALARFQRENGYNDWHMSLEGGWEQSLSACSVDFFPGGVGLSATLSITHPWGHCWYMAYLVVKMDQGDVCLSLGVSQRYLLFVGEDEAVACVAVADLLHALVDAGHGLALDPGSDVVIGGELQHLLDLVAGSNH